MQQTQSSVAGPSRFDDPFEKILPPAAGQQMKEVLTLGAGKGRACAVSLDRTLIAGEIGAGTFSRLAEQGLIDSTLVPECLTAESFASLPLAKRYEAFRSRALRTEDQGERELLLRNLYAQVVCAQGGLTALQVVRATAEGASALGIYAVPDTLILVGEAIRRGYEVRVFSSSNHFAAVWAVQNLVNPKLRELGYPIIPLRNVRGLLNEMVTDAGGKVTPDVIFDMLPETGWPNDHVLSSIQLNGGLFVPPPIFEGRAEALKEACGQRPWLAVGTLEDFSMLELADFRLVTILEDRPNALVPIRAAHRLPAPTDAHQACWWGRTATFAARPVPRPAL